MKFSRCFGALGVMVLVLGGTWCRAACPISNETNAFESTTAQTLTDNSFLLNFESCTDHVYVVYSTASLGSNADWMTVAWMRGDAGITTWAGPAPAAQQQFYRVLRLTASGDYSGGGIPNGWAADHGLNPADPDVAQEDPDGDGFDNLEEYVLGTDPTNAVSRPGSDVLENLATQLIYVAMTGSDGNAGTAAAPYRTIQKAATVAQAASQSGTGSQIIIGPGTYRESISLVATTGNMLAPVIFSAATNGTVTISGLDVRTNGWSLTAGTTNVYQSSWTNNWGLAPIPSGWSSTLTNIVRRSEIVFANGVLLTQVLTRAAMTNGTFFVDDPDSLLYVQNRAGVDAGTAYYEVAERSNLLNVASANGHIPGNVVLRGLEFRGAASRVSYTAVEFSNATNVLVDECTFDWNNWSGMSFSACNGVTVRDCVANHNGAMGIEIGYHEKNIVADGDQTCFNNWRGAWGGFYGFSIAGIKALNVHTGLFRNHVSVGNLTYGLWLDFDNKNDFIENCVYNVNREEGLQLEGTEGPARIQQCVSSRDSNGNFGLLMQNAQNVTVLDCSFNGSETSSGSGDIGCSVATSRAVTDWETGATYTLFSSNWTLLDNSCISAGSSQYGLYMLTNFPGFLSTLSSDSNHWYNVGSNPQFDIGGTKDSLAGWQSLSHQDAHSDAVNLLLTNADTQDTYLQLNAVTSNGSAASGLCATLTNGTGVLDVLLLKFNLSSLTNGLREAELQLAASSVTNGPVVFYVYPLVSDWDENATSALARPDSNTSWAAGAFSAADYDTQPAGVGITGGGSGLNTFVDVTALARNWVTGKSPNYGVVIIAQPVWNQAVPNGSNLQQFGVSTREAASFHPQLTFVPE